MMDFLVKFIVKSTGQTYVHPEVTLRCMRTITNEAYLADQEDEFKDLLTDLIKTHRVEKNMPPMDGTKSLYEWKLDTWRQGSVTSGAENTERNNKIWEWCAGGDTGDDDEAGFPENAETMVVLSESKALPSTAFPEDAVEAVTDLRSAMETGTLADALQRVFGPDRVADEGAARSPAASGGGGLNPQVSPFKTQQQKYEAERAHMEWRAKLKKAYDDNRERVHDIMKKSPFFTSPPPTEEQLERQAALEQQRMETRIRTKPPESPKPPLRKPSGWTPPPKPKTSNPRWTPPDKPDTLPFGFKRKPGKSSRIESADMARVAGSQILDPPPIIRAPEPPSDGVHDDGFTVRF